MVRIGITNPVTRSPDIPFPLQSLRLICVLWFHDKTIMQRPNLGYALKIQEI